MKLLRSLLLGLVALIALLAASSDRPAQAATFTVTETPIGAPAPVPKTFANGDVDCDEDVDAVDSFGVLRYVAGLSVSQEEPCPSIGSLGHSGFFGDVDCDGDVDAVDALKILRYVAGLSVSQQPGCPAIGTPLPGL